MRFLPVVTALCGLGAWVALFASFTNPAIRTTLWPVWLLAALAVALGVFTLLKVRPLSWPARGAAFFGMGLALAFGLLYGAVLRVPTEGGRPQAGAPLPEFELLAEDGKLLRSSDYKGKGPVLYVFFRGFW